MKTANQIRRDFIEFFTGKQHTFVPSSPVVPQDDPTLLFTNAGMNQFKAIFLGENPRGLKRAANSQKCMRVSGKHNDLEEVGRDHHHHTLFEMLGNWSFGDYYKKEAIGWAWELITGVWKLPKARLYATVYEEDDEAVELWKSQTDIAHDHIRRFDADSNFWEMGDTGPCGPCSEIHIDVGPGHCINEGKPGHTCDVNADSCGRFIEIWNLVFMQYNRDGSGTLHPLPARHVDTGMGFERVTRIIQGRTSNYDTDVFSPLIAEVERMCGKTYSSEPSGTPFRVIADHIRALVFAITDGAIPSNEGRGYVLRRLLRRAFRFGRELGFHEPFMYRLVPVLVKMMGDAFPEITQRVAYVQDVIRSEEERFGATLEQGIEKFNAMVAAAKGTTLAGSDVFMLYDTYGFPMDLTRLMAEEKGFSVDEAGFEAAMGRQRERARDAARKGSADGLSPEGWVELANSTGSTFTGYDSETGNGKVYRYKELGDCQYLLCLDHTPFYAESGGQVGDRGTLQTATGVVLDVLDTVKWNDLSVHRVRAARPLRKSDLAQPLTAEVDRGSRAATRRNHSATHLLQAALRATLGEHVQQSGSRVGPEGLRFDFTHFRAMSPEELQAVEKQVNEWVFAGLAVGTAVKDVDEAKAAGAMALFGEKYGEKVRVVNMGPVSLELCGGTHVSNTAEIGLFHIVEESSIAAGVRRIEAITGPSALAYLLERQAQLKQAALLLKVRESGVAERVRQLLEEQRSQEARIVRLGAQASAGQVEQILSEARDNGGVFPWVVKDLGELDKDAFARLTDALSDELRGRQDSSAAVVLGARVEGKALFAACAADATVRKHKVHCGELVKAAASVAGGGGGGRPNRAQAGGKLPEKVAEALASVADVLKGKAGAA